MFYCFEQCTMGRNKNVSVWRHFTTTNNGTECNFCKKVYKFKNVNKLESHLLSCLHCPDMIRAQFNKKPSQTSTQGSTQSSNIVRSLIGNESSTSAIAMSSPQSSRASSPQSSRASTPQSSRASTPSRADTPTLMSMTPLAKFFDRMSDQENVSHTTFSQFELFLIIH